MLSYFCFRWWRRRLYGTLAHKLSERNSVLYLLFAVIFNSWCAQVLSYFIIIRLPFSSPHFCSIIWFTICTVCAHIVRFLNFPRQFKLHEHFIFFFLHLSVRSTRLGKSTGDGCCFFFFILSPFDSRLSGVKLPRCHH